MLVVAHAPWIFLALSIVSLLLSLNVERPIRWPATVAVLSFFAGWLTSELVFHALAIQLGIIVVSVAAGGMSAWPGWVALACSLAAIALLLRSLASSRAAAGAVRDALSRGLGEDYRPDVGEASSALAPLEFGFGALALPFRIRHPEVERIRDVVYVQGERHRLRLDVYRKKDGGSRRPALLQVHGGGWIVGSKDQQGLPLVTHLASRGWVCVSANYRLSPRATFPDPLIDLKHALAWIREHAEEIGADPDFVVVTGGSAGGHLATLVALTANEPSYQPGFEGVDTSVRACVAFYGVYDFTDRYGVWPHRGLHRLLEWWVVKAPLASARDRFERASPMGQVHDRAPPFLIVHGDRDTMVPVEEARHFARDLRSVSKAPVVYLEVPGAQHAFEVMPSIRTASVIRGVEQFLTTVHAHYERERALAT